MTPIEIQRKRNQILDKRSITWLTQETMLRNLYEEVLKHIAEGSIDPRSLALAALGQEKF